MINEKNIYLDTFIIKKNINRYNEIIKNLKKDYKNLQIKTPADKKIYKNLLNNFNDIILGYQNSYDKLRYPLEKREEREKEKILNLKRIENQKKEWELLKSHYETKIFFNPTEKNILNKELRGFKKTINNFIDSLEKNNQELNYILETNNIIDYFKSF